MSPPSRAEMLAGRGSERGSAFRGAGPPALFERLDAFQTLDPGGMVSHPPWKAHVRLLVRPGPSGWAGGMAARPEDVRTPHRAPC